MGLSRPGLIVIAVLLAVSALAESNEDDEDTRRTKELTKAMQAAQLLISELSDTFGCNYAGYDVTRIDEGDTTTYVVVIEVEEDTCDEMMKALNDEGARSNLAFVSEKKIPAMRPLSEPGPGPVEELRPPPADYSLIHEIDPPVER